MYMIRLLLVLLLAVVVSAKTAKKEKKGNLCKTGFGSTLHFYDVLVAGWPMMLHRGSIYVAAF